MYNLKILQTMLIKQANKIKQAVSIQNLIAGGQGHENQ